MGVFKNGVGRPSKETIKKRNIFKGLCIVLLLIVIALVVYIVNDNINNKPNKTSNVTKNTTSKIKKGDVDINKIKIENNDEGYFEKLLYNDKEVDLKINPEGILYVNEPIKFSNLALFRVDLNDCSLLLAMNNNREIVAVFGDHANRGIYSDKSKIIELSSYVLGRNPGSTHNQNYFKIDGNKITLYSNDLGQEVCYVCVKDDNDAVIYEDTFKYENKEFKKVSSKVISRAKDKKQLEDCKVQCNN